MSDEQPVQKASKHICLTNRHALGISDDPEHDMLIALADKDVLTLARGLSKEEARSPFPDGLFGMDGPRTNEAGLISSRRDGPDHVYVLNAGRFRDLAHFLEKLIHEDVH